MVNLVSSMSTRPVTCIDSPRVRRRQPRGDLFPVLAGAVQVVVAGCDEDHRPFREQFQVFAENDDQGLHRMLDRADHVREVPDEATASVPRGPDQPVEVRQPVVQVRDCQNPHGAILPYAAAGVAGPGRDQANMGIRQRGPSCPFLTTRVPLVDGSPGRRGSGRSERPPATRAVGIPGCISTEEKAARRCWGGGDALARRRLPRGLSVEPRAVGQQPGVTGRERSV